MAVTWALVALACSDGTGPDGTRLTGTFAFTVLFDERPAASGSGSIKFVQPDANDPELRITGAFTATPINGVLTQFRDGTLSPDGVVRFRVEATYPWQFDGRVGTDIHGTSITGRHTLVGGGLSGQWHAFKKADNTIPPPVSLSR